MLDIYDDSPLSVETPWITEVTSWKIASCQWTVALLSSKSWFA